MAQDRESAGGSSERKDPRSADPEAAARELADSEGISFEAALEDVRASIVKREAAARRIRAIAEQVRATLAAREAEAEAGQDGQNARPDEGTAVGEAQPKDAA